MREIKGNVLDVFSGEIFAGRILIEGRKIAKMALPVAGLMSGKGAESVAKSLELLSTAAKGLGCGLRAPFMTLSFMALPVIPELKITDKDLFDSKDFRFEEVVISKPS